MTRGKGWCSSAVTHTAMVTVILFVLTKGITCQPGMSESCHRSLRDNRLTTLLSTALIRPRRSDNKDSQMKMGSVEREDIYRLPFSHPQYGKYPFQYHLGINHKTQQETARNTLNDSDSLLTMMNADVQLINHFFKNPYYVKIKPKHPHLPLEKGKIRQSD